jgi:hypothetical protein
MFTDKGTDDDLSIHKGRERRERDMLAVAMHSIMLDLPATTPPE